MIAPDEIPFAPRHEPGQWRPANYAEQEAAKVPRVLGYQSVFRGFGPQWLMCRNDASMHRYRVNGPYWWVAMRYSNGQTTVHLFDTECDARWLINHRYRWKSGVYMGHGRVRFKS